MEKSDRPTWRSGFVHCRLVGADESSGTVKQVAGVHARIRASTIDLYHQEEAGIILIQRLGDEDPMYIVGELADLDKAMARDATRLQAVPSSDE